MKCNPACGRTGMLDKETGHRMMISQSGEKFPKGVLHPQCSACLKAETDEMNEASLYEGDQTLLDKYKEAKKKFG